MSTQTRGTALAQRMNAVGISKSEFAARAKVDRGTVDRALEDDPTMQDRTWAKLDRAAEALEDELGMAESGNLVTTTIEVNGAHVTVKGSPADVAETVKRMLT